MGAYLGLYSFTFRGREAWIEVLDNGSAAENSTNNLGGLLKGEEALREEEVQKEIKKFHLCCVDLLLDA